MQNLLLLTLFLPLAGALLIALTARADKLLARKLALGTSLLTVLGTALLVYNFDNAKLEGGFFAGSSFPWLGADSPIKINLSVGLDGLALWLFGLSALLTLTSVLVSWEAITERPAFFYALLLVLETGMLGVFTARDIILFYVFFEFTLIPLFFLIGIWGSEDRRYAAVKFFLYTLAGSLLTFLGLLTIVLWNKTATGTLTFDIAQLTASLQNNPMPNTAASGYLQLMVFLALFIGFAIKVPLFPLHTWLPLAHTQAPTAGSVLLAGILLKIGTYGFLRFSLPMLPEAAAWCTPALLMLSAAGIVYGALVALSQTDVKRLIAYSSVSHLGYCMAGIFALNLLGMQGGALQMINHGISTGGLFAIVGMIYERYHTREIAAFGGLARRIPLLCLMFVIFTFSSIGLPGLNGFAGEFMILCGLFERAYAESPATVRAQLLTCAVMGVAGVVLGAWYMLYLVKRVFFGPLVEPSLDHGHGHGDHGHKKGKHNHNDSHGHDDSHGHGALAPLADNGIRDLNLREFFALAPLLVFMFWIGLHPNHFLKPMEPVVRSIVPPVSQAFEKRFAVVPATKSSVSATALLPAHDTGRAAAQVSHDHAAARLPSSAELHVDGVAAR